jgi:hypothetical protein
MKYQSCWYKVFTPTQRALAIRFNAILETTVTTPTFLVRKERYLLLKDDNRVRVTAVLDVTLKKYPILQFHLHAARTLKNSRKNLKSHKLHNAYNSTEENKKLVTTARQGQGRDSKQVPHDALPPS